MTDRITDTPFDELLSMYRSKAHAAAGSAFEASKRERAKKLYVADKVQGLLEGDDKNPSTGRKWSATAARQNVKSTEEYQESAIEVDRLRMEAEKQRADATALKLALKFKISSSYNTDNGDNHNDELPF